MQSENVICNAICCNLNAKYTSILGEDKCIALERSDSLGPKKKKKSRKSAKKTRKHKVYIGSLCKLLMW